MFLSSSPYLNEVIIVMLERLYSEKEQFTYLTRIWIIGDATKIQTSNMHQLFIDNDIVYAP